MYIFVETLLNSALWQNVPWKAAQVAAEGPVTGGEGMSPLICSDSVMFSLARNIMLLSDRRSIHSMVQAFLEEAYSLYSEAICHHHVFSTGSPRRNNSYFSLIICLVTG